MSVSLINANGIDLLQQTRERKAANTADPTGAAGSAAAGAAGVQGSVPNGSPAASSVPDTNSPSSVVTFGPGAQMLAQWASQGVTVAWFSLASFGLTSTDINNAEQSKQ